MGDAHDHFHTYRKYNTENDHLCVIQPTTETFTHILFGACSMHTAQCTQMSVCVCAEDVVEKERRLLLSLSLSVVTLEKHNKSMATRMGGGKQTRKDMQLLAIYRHKKITT